MFRPLLNFLKCQRNRMLSASQVFLEWLGRIQFKAFVPHQLPCLAKRILASSKLEVVNIDAQDDLQFGVKIEAFSTKNALKTIVLKSFGIMPLPI